jgi:hypothetical protein
MPKNYNRSSRQTMSTKWKKSWPIKIDAYARKSFLKSKGVGKDTLPASTHGYRKRISFYPQRPMEIPRRKSPPSRNCVFCSVIPMPDSHHYFHDVSFKRSQSWFLDGHVKFLGGLRPDESSDGEYKTAEILQQLITSLWVNHNTLGNRTASWRGDGFATKKRAWNIVNNINRTNPCTFTNVWWFRTDGSPSLWDPSIRVFVGKWKPI